MTLTNPNYYDEIIGTLRRNHVDVKDFILIATKEKILERLYKRKNSTPWAYEQVNRCIDAFNNHFNGYKIDTNYSSVDEISEKF